MGISLLLMPLPIALHALFSPAVSYTAIETPERLSALNALAARVAAAHKPIISDEMVMLLTSGKSVVWEPAIFAELASKGTWDERPLIKRIHNHEFAMFITADAGGNQMFQRRYNPAVAAAINQDYPIVSYYAGYNARLPRP